MTSENIHSIAKIHHLRFDSYYTITANSTPEDPRLSWAAKGLLWYILSKEKNWSIHVWQLAKIYEGDKKGNGKDAVQELIRELRNAGYIKYIKYRDSEGKWNHRYDVFPIPFNEFQKMFPERDHPALDHPALVNPAILPNKELPSNELPIKEKQQHKQAASPSLAAAASPSVVSSSKKVDEQQKPPKPKIHPCLEKVDIPEVDKVEITRRYQEDLVKNAIAWALHPQTKINSTLVAAIKWACQNKPEVPKNEKDIIQKNIELARKFDGMSSTYVTVDVLSSCVEIVYKGGQKEPIVVSFQEKQFVEKFKEALRKVKLIE